ncbi:Protein phosphatase 1 regulatory subunit 37 [Amphibalanus amphitrite]|uniref:Protein phosphatase 1 regulatory subunit 37 n=1 Tax=Amphibalanus amphitrite TaxID=1232801 RepID=A0A6A4W4G8_AMPAM|nr:Protein phosphatase 1 regulatory subunit 37 [Amphibalanus amphitrite]
METCQALPAPGSAPPLTCDVIDADIDGGATTEQRSDDELHSPPPASANMKTHRSSPTFPNGDHDILNSGSQEDDSDADARLDDSPPCDSPDCIEDDAEGSPTSPSEASSDPSAPTPRSCMRRCRPARRRSDSAADRLPFSPLRRGSQAPPPPPRRVHFPESPVTAVIPAADPLRLLGDTNAAEAYRAACVRHGAAPLPEVLRQLEQPSADVLRLSGVKLSLSDVDSLEEVMRRRRWLRIEAADCALRGETLAALMQIVRHYDATPWLNLGGADSERLGWAAVCGAVRDAGRRSALQWLALDRTALGEVAAAQLGRNVRDSWLRVLHLEKCHLHGRPLLTLLAGGLRAATGLRQLYLGDNGLGSGDGSLLGAALRQNTSLQLLDLRNNAFDDDAAGYLLAGLAEQQPTPPHTGLLTLNLWHNQLTEESAGPIAALLAAHPALETLNLGFNALGDATAARLAEPLTRHGPLRRLGLQACRLGDEAATALGGALATGSGLVRLDLRGNHLTSGGLRALLDAVRGNTTLRQLDLNQEPIAEPAPERALSSVPEGALPESAQETSSDVCDGDRGSPERADSGIDSPAKFASSGGSGDGDGSGGMEGEIELEGAALGSSVDSTLGSSAGSNPPTFSAATDRRDSGDGAESGGGDSDSDSTPVGEYRSLYLSLGAACEENRRRPAPESAADTPSPPPADADDEPGSGHWLRRKLSAALRRVSLTCETPLPRLPQPSSVSSTTSPTTTTTTSTAAASPSGSPTAAQPVPVPERPRHRRLVSPSPSPSESPLPSPTSGRPRFRVFRVSSAELPPGTPPLMRGLPRTLSECDGESAPSFLRDGSPVPTRLESPVPPEEDLSAAPVRKDSIAVLKERSHRAHAGGGDTREGESGKNGLTTSLENVCEMAGETWSDEVNPDSSRLTNGSLSPLGKGWTRASSPGSLDSGGGGAGSCQTPVEPWRPPPAASPRPAGRKFRVTPVRETIGPA